MRRGRELIICLLANREGERDEGRLNVEESKGGEREGGDSATREGAVRSFVALSCTLTLLGDIVI